MTIPPEQLDVNVAQAKTWLESETPPRLVDCREEDEYAICHLENAQLFPLSRWAEQMPKAFGDKEQPILIYCHHGVRSRRAADYMRSVGYTNVHSMSGGIDAWSTEIDRSVPRY